MADKNHALLVQRQGMLVGRLVAEMAHGQDANKIKRLIEQLAWVDSILARTRRRKAVVWTVRGLTLAVIVALVLSRLSLREATVNLGAGTRAAIVDVGPASENVVPVSFMLKRVQIDASVQSCVSTEKNDTNRCLSVDLLRLNSLNLHREAAVSFEAQDGCVVVSVMGGGADVLLTMQERQSSEDVKTASHGLKPGESAKLCPSTEGELYVSRPSRVLLGSRIKLGPADELITPAIQQGTMSIADTGQSQSVGPADVVALDLRDGAMTVRIVQRLDVTVVGTVSSGSVSNGTGTHERPVVPTWLDWLVSSPTIRLVLSILGAVVAFAISTRDRIVAELAG